MSTLISMASAFFLGSACALAEISLVEKFVIAGGAFSSTQERVRSPEAAQIRVIRVLFPKNKN
jgi:hypothetical protein